MQRQHPRDVHRDNPLLALSYMLAAQVFFSLNILLLRICEEWEQTYRSPTFELGHWEAMLFRSFVLCSWCFVILKRTKRVTLRRDETLWLWARGIVGVLSLTSYYYGVLHIPLGMASLFSNSSPLYLALLASFLSKERVGAWGIVALLGGFLGLGCVAWSGLQSVHGMAVSGILIAALSGPLSATAYFSIRKLKDVPNEQIMLSLGLAGTLVSVLCIAISGAHFPESLPGRLALLGSALPALFAQVCLTRAFRYGPAAQVAPLQYAGPVCSTILAFLCLDESLPVVALGGMSLVICFGLVLPYWRAKVMASPPQSVGR